MRGEHELSIDDASLPVLDAMRQVVGSLVLGGPTATFPDDVRGRSAVTELLARNLASAGVVDLVVRILEPMSLGGAAFEAFADIQAGLVPCRRVIVTEGTPVAIPLTGKPPAAVVVASHTPLPWALYLVEGHLAIIRPHTGNVLHVLNRPGELVDAIAGLHEALWRLCRGAEPNATVTMPPRHLRSVINSLASGLTDQAAQRALELSSRTFSRRTSELMTALGARSRFQAGVAAAHRRWV